MSLSVVRYCLCQDCLKVYPYSHARHNDEEFCSCGGQLCGCDSCSVDAYQKLLKEGYDVSKVGDVSPILSNSSC